MSLGHSVNGCLLSLDEWSCRLFFCFRFEFGCVKKALVRRRENVARRARSCVGWLSAGQTTVKFIDEHICSLLTIHLTSNSDSIRVEVMPLCLIQSPRTASFVLCHDKRDNRHFAFGEDPISWCGSQSCTAVKQDIGQSVDNYRT